jgi:hypothetical protein
MGIASYLLLNHTIRAALDFEQLEWQRGVACSGAEAAAK